MIGLHAVRFPEPGGLVPAVVQDATDGRVLMVAYVDAEALAATLETAEVHFHSRSRGRLWRKGEISGNVLRLRDLAVDCDGDALLIRAEPAGPTCHRGTRSCFDPEPAASGAIEPNAAAVPASAGVLATPSTAGVAAAGGASEPGSGGDAGFAWLEVLWATILQRAADRPAGSYTARLLAGGVDAAGRKVIEEATEVLLAAKDDATAETSGADRSGTRSAMAGEAADLLYHVMVLLAERGLPPTEVITRLRERHLG